MKKNVLLLETIADEALALLSGSVNVVRAKDDTSLPATFKGQDIHAVITRGKGQINKKLLDSCPRLEVAARCGVGLDNVDVEEASARNVKVINAPGANAATIAEHSLSLMLMLIRQMYESVAQVKSGNWNWRNTYSGDELNGKTLGILGMGNIGKRVARLADAFGMNVLYWSRSVQDLPYRFTSLEEVLKQSDIVSLHLPFSPETGCLIQKEQLALMKPGSFLVNTARGALIDHQALFGALTAGRLAGFAADVLPEEPPAADDPVLLHPRSLITPHSGSLTATTYTEMCVYTVTNVLAVLKGEEPEAKSVFNREALAKKQ